MKRSQIIMIVCAAACLLLCAGAAWFLFDAQADAGRARDERASESRRLDQIYNAPVFPNAANVGLIKDSLAEIAGWTDAIRETLHAGNLDPQPLEPNELNLKLQSTVNELRDLSPTPGQPVVDANFFFGFDRYLGGANAMPDRAHTPRLTQQLAIVETLSREILKTDIQKLSQFSREVFEDGARAAAAPPRGGEAQAVATSERFTLRVTARQNGVAEVLNTLSTSPLFVTVTSVALYKASPEDVLPPVPELVAKVVPQGTQVAHGELAWPPDEQRVVAGPDVLPVMEAIIEFDVLTFNPPQA